MQKQPHRAVEKTADNRYWQNQFILFYMNIRN